MKKTITEMIKMAGEVVERGNGYTKQEWEEMPDYFVGFCDKNCFGPRVFKQGAMLDYGVRGVYICTGCGYACPPFLEPEMIVGFDYDPEAEEWQIIREE